ncbi:MAG: hypothetical protein V3573_11325 [Desulfovibrionaceae bacterium]
MSDRSQEFLCKAMELAKESGAFFEKTLHSCGDGLGREVFDLLADQGSQHKERIGEIYDALRRGSDWEGACSLDEADVQNVQDVFQAMAEKYAPKGSCATELTAARAALDLQAAAVGLYDVWLEESEEGQEQRFVNRMIGELREQRVLLADLIEYYEDPEGWAMAQERGGLDGA